MGNFKHKISEVFKTDKISFEDTERVIEEQKLEEKKKDELYAVKDKIVELGYKITDINIEQGQYEVEVRKGTKTKILKIDTKELKSPTSLLDSISNELSK
jgi:hypothetical protein